MACGNWIEKIAPIINVPVKSYFKIFDPAKISQTMFDPAGIKLITGLLAKGGEGVRKVKSTPSIFNPSFCEHMVCSCGHMFVSWQGITSKAHILFMYGYVRVPMCGLAQLHTCSYLKCWRCRVSKHIPSSTHALTRVCQQKTTSITITTSEERNFYL